MAKPLRPTSTKRHVPRGILQGVAVITDVYPSYGFILLETGDFVLLESGDKIKRE